MPKSFENQSELHTPETVKRQDFRAWQQEIRTVSPGIIQSVNGFRCDVLPAWKRKFGAQDVSHSVLLDVPIILPSAAGFSFSGPIATGSECLILWAERETESFILTGAESAVRHSRLHDYADPFVIPCALSDPATQGLPIPDEDTLCLFGSDGKKLKIDVNGVNLVECMRDMADALRNVATTAGAAPEALIAQQISTKLGTLL